MESKLLTYLKVPSSVSDDFPKEIKDYVTLLDGMQLIYSQTKNEDKKPFLAASISVGVRGLMQYLKNKNIGFWTENLVKIEEQKLEEQEEEPKGQQPNILPPQPKGSKPQPPQQEPPVHSQPPVEQPAEPLPTKEELKKTIKVLERYAKQGDVNAKQSLKGLKRILKVLND